MKKYFVFSLLVLFLSIGFVVALPNFQPNDLIPSNNHATINIPEKATEVAPDIFSLGTVVDVDGRVVQGYAIVDRREGHAKPGAVCGNDICEPGEKKSCSADCAGNGGDEKSSCYANFAKGAKWKVNEDYIVDASNNANLSESFISNTISNAIDKWEVEAGNVFGNEVAGSVDIDNIDGLNGVNEVAFANINSPGAIGVTYVWGIFSGPPRGRELVEWNQVYDDVDFSWSDSGEVGKMDFENIVQHEHGHAFGMAHPSDDCTEETMFRFAGLGETKKRSLNAGDITGISKLYK